jgi:hypothetical protein
MRVHGGVVLSAGLELFGTFSFKRKSTEKKILLLKLFSTFFALMQRK